MIYLIVRNNLLLAVSILIIGIILLISPNYKRYKRFLWEKFGYWNVAVSFLIIIFSNFVGIAISGKIMVFFLIPLDVVFLIDAVVVYFRIRNFKKNK